MQQVTGWQLLSIGDIYFQLSILELKIGGKWSKGQNSSFWKGQNYSKTVQKAQTQAFQKIETF
jgi:hypothetical protein